MVHNLFFYTSIKIVRVQFKVKYPAATPRGISAGPGVRYYATGSE